eukprot:12408507-Karenia_brevis.AAC.1
MEQKNSEACEQLNAWISKRSHTALERTHGRYLLFWWILFIEHKEDLEEQAAALRRRYARGGMKHNPDVPRS